MVNVFTAAANNQDVSLEGLQKVTGRWESIYKNQSNGGKCNEVHDRKSKMMVTGIALGTVAAGEWRR